MSHYFSDQLSRYRVSRALKTMQQLPNFDRDFNDMVREKSRKQADNVLKMKDPPISEFNRMSIQNFDYEDELHKYEQLVPTLISSIAGTISSSKDENIENLSRKGFGGSRQSEDVSLVPAIVQTSSCLLRNRHPNSVTKVACMNSINNYLNHVTKQNFHLANSLGLSFRYVTYNSKS